MSRAEEILAWWFEGGDDAHPIGPGSPCYQRWFRGGPLVDAQVAERFAEDVHAARAGALDGWRGSARGELALILLLDQFPRHLFRGRAEAFASDAAALDISRACIAAHRDEQLALIERIFIYLPIQHSERIADHELAFDRFRALEAQARARSAGVVALCVGAIGEQQEHFDTLQRFGRYPYRNAGPRPRFDGGGTGVPGEPEMTADDALAVLRSAPAFDRLPADALQRLAAGITEAKAVPGQAIVREGDAGDRMFFVASGSVQVLGRSFDGSNIVLARLESGAYFGEQALLSGSGARRNATVRALTHCRLLVLTRDGLLSVLEPGSAVAQELRATAREHDELRAGRLREGVLRQLGVADRYRIETFTPGSFVFRQGDPADRLYLVLEGRARVSKTAPTAPRPI